MIMQNVVIIWYEFLKKLQISIFADDHLVSKTKQNYLICLQSILVDNFVKYINHEFTNFLDKVFIIYYILLGTISKRLFTCNQATTSII